MRSVEYRETYKRKMCSVLWSRGQPWCVIILYLHGDRMKNRRKIIAISGINAQFYPDGLITGNRIITFFDDTKRGVGKI